MNKRDFNDLMIKVKNEFHKFDDGEGYICWAFENVGYDMEFAGVYLADFFNRGNSSSTGIFGKVGSRYILSYNSSRADTRKLALEMFHQISLIEGYYKRYHFIKVGEDI